MAPSVRAKKSPDNADDDDLGEQAEESSEDVILSQAAQRKAEKKKRKKKAKQAAAAAKKTPETTGTNTAADTDTADAASVPGPAPASSTATAPEQTSTTPSSAEETPRPEPARVNGTKQFDGPLIVNGSHHRRTSKSDTSASRNDAGQDGRGERLNPASSGLVHGGPNVRDGVDYASESSSTLRGDSPPEQRRFQETRPSHPYPNSNSDNRPQAHFETNGIVFGNHEDSGPPSGNDSPVHQPPPPNFCYFSPHPHPYPHPYPHPSYPSQTPHPYPRYPSYPAYPGYLNPLYVPPPYGDPNMMIPGYPPPPEYTGYMHPYYQNPVYRAHSQTYHPGPGDNTPEYGSGDSAANHGTEVWSGDYGTQLCTPVTVDSDKENLYADDEEFADEPDKGATNEARQYEQQQEERIEGDAQPMQPVQDTSVLQDGADNEPGTTTTNVGTAEADKDATPAVLETVALDTRDEDEDDDLEPTSTYLLRAFKSGELADYQLLLESPVSRFYTVSFFAHGLIMARSPALYSRMLLGEQRLVTITTGNSFVQPKAFEIAVQNLYGLPLVKESQLASQVFLTLGYEAGAARDCGGKVESSYNARMDFALCYAASGAFLANSSIVRRGIQLASSSITWETVETALRFGLAANSFTLACADSVQPEEFTKRGSETDSVNSPAAENGTNSTWATSYFAGSTLNKELVEVHAAEVLRKALEFVAQHIPSDFELYPDAQPTVMPGRFPDGPGRSASRVSSIVTFGNFATSTDGDKTADAPNRETAVTSAIMLSLPFKCLRKLFKYMGSWRTLTKKIVENVVSERERRRVRVLRMLNSRVSGGSNNSDGDGADTVYLPDPLEWEESVGTPPDGRSYRKITIIKTWKGPRAAPLTFGPEKSGEP